jgi:catechol 2,3-dioxygenase-like lactoylglutathione lyase family enzyme
VSDRPDLDHTSFAVRDATQWAHRLRRTLGATPIAGETLPEFRYLLLHVGTAEAGGRLELIEPMADGFVTRFLDRRGGDGPHHITVTVPDLRATVAAVRRIGLTVTGEDYDHPLWQEAFIAPDTFHGVVVQLAHSDATYPSPAELLVSRHRETDSFPSSAGATDRTWWASVWDVEPQAGAAVLGATHVTSTSVEMSRRLFADVLGADTTEQADGAEFRWPSGAVRVRPGRTPGITRVDVTNGPRGGLTIGRTVLSEPAMEESET